MIQKDFLVELGTEELPPKRLKAFPRLSPRALLIA